MVQNRKMKPDGPRLAIDKQCFKVGNGYLVVQGQKLLVWSKIGKWYQAVTGRQRIPSGPRSANGT